MKSRRNFLISTSTASTVLGGAALFGTASNAAAAAIGPISDAELDRQMIGKLERELNDKAAAATEAPHLKNIFLEWSLPTLAAADTTAIHAYSFGDRAAVQPSSPPEAGLVNALIADAVYALLRLKPVMVYAQWEVASVLTAKYGMGSAVLKSLPAPTLSSAGTVNQLPLDAIAAALQALAGGPTAAPGKVAVVTHRDLAKRALQASKSVGMDAYAPAEVPLPTAYDAQASQRAFRRRDLYLLNDIGNQLGALRLKLIAEAYPNG